MAPNLVEKYLWRRFDLEPAFFKFSNILMSDTVDKFPTEIPKSNLGLYLSLAVIILIFLTGLFDSISKSWTGDDTFISFRYAKNFVEGKGLVYNLGEQVEGYTNFLWTILIALGMKLNIDPIKFTNVLGIIAFALTILTFIYISWRLLGARGHLGVFLPLTALCLLVHHDFKVFATGGLETSFFTFLLTLGFAGLIFSKNKNHFLLSGFILVLAMMTRPDGIIFYLFSVVFLVLTASPTPKRWLYFLIPLIVVYIPYYIFRFLYYHYPFPNTYYARSAYLPWWNQGLNYAILYFKSYYVFLLLPAWGVISIIKTKPSLKKITNLPLPFNPLQNAVFLSVLFSLIYSLYVIRVGGDFMFARFFIPITPFLYFLMEVFACRILDKKYLIPFVVMACLTTYFYRYPNEIGTQGNDIVDERLFYPNWRIEEAKLKGGILKKYLKDTEAQVVIFGSQAMLAYYAELPTVIEGTNGLTDEYIAHLPIGKRARPGHEKTASLEYLLRRGVNFSFVFGVWNPPPSADFNEIYFEDLRGNIIVYNRDLMRELATYDKVTFFDFERFLDEYIQKMPLFPRSRILKDYEFFKRYYFNHNPDPIRENAFINALASD